MGLNYKFNFKLAFSQNLGITIFFTVIATLIHIDYTYIPSAYMLIVSSTFVMVLTDYILTLTYDMIVFALKS